VDVARPVEEVFALVTQPENVPRDQLLQIRGAVAEYEHTLIAERMRRGRQARLRAGTLPPWTRVPFGYRLDPERPGEVAGVRVAPDEAVLVAQLFDWYPQPQATLYRLAKRSLRMSPKREEEAYELHNIGPAVRGSRRGSPPEQVPLAR
jgi:hypothetical protein